MAAELTIAKNSNRRFTRLTNGFSKKLENHSHALAVHFFHCNFCPIHKSRKVTPAMQAGVTEERMDISHLVRLIDMMEEPPKPRGPYKRKSLVVLSARPTLLQG